METRKYFQYFALIQEFMGKRPRQSMTPSRQGWSGADFRFKLSKSSERVFRRLAAT